jgi:hypothetical protein
VHDNSSNPMRRILITGFPTADDLKNYLITPDALEQATLASIVLDSIQEDVDKATGKPAISIAVRYNHGASSMVDSIDKEKNIKKWNEGAKNFVAKAVLDIHTQLHGLKVEDEGKLIKTLSSKTSRNIARRTKSTARGWQPPKVQSTKLTRLKPPLLLLK